MNDNIKKKGEELLKNGVNVLPTKKDKRPMVKWGHLNTEQLSEEEFNSFPWDRAVGLAMVTGKMSGGLEAIDFDMKNGLSNDVYEDIFLELQEQVGDMRKKVLMQKTPSGGRHWIYRCDEIGPNMKLCLDEEGKTLIETRGQGGFVLSEPTDGYKYLNANGSIPKLTVMERRVLLRILLSYDQSGKGKVKDEVRIRDKGNRKFISKKSPDLPVAFKEFNEAHDMGEMLSADGWEEIEEGVAVVNGVKKSILRMRRPDKDAGTSGTLFVGDNTFYNFSSTVDLPINEMMSPAEYIMHRDHDGNKAAMLLYLGDLGYKSEKEMDELPDKFDSGQDIEERRKQLKLIRAISRVIKPRFNLISEQLEREGGDFGYVGLESRYVAATLRLNGFKVKLESVRDALSLTDHFPQVDPPADWLRGLKWDGAERLDELADYVQCADPQRWALHLKKHMVRCVRQLFLEGENRYALILHSEEQGNGKSTFIRWLTKAGPMGAYYTEDVPHENRQNEIPRFLSSRAHCNMEEMDAFRAKDINYLKSLTTRVDASHRKNYAETTNMVKRRINFWGSTNNSAFLTDSSNTRWVLHEVQAIDFGYVELDVDQLWAEAVHLYLEGYDCDLSKEEIASNETVADKFKNYQMEPQVILDVIQPASEEDGEFLPNIDLRKMLFDYWSNKDSAVYDELRKQGSRSIGYALSNIGFKRAIKKVKGKTMRGVYVSYTENG